LATQGWLDLVCTPQPFTSKHHALRALAANIHSQASNNLVEPVDDERYYAVNSTARSPGGTSAQHTCSNL